MASEAGTDGLREALRRWERSASEPGIMSVREQITSIRNHGYRHIYEFLETAVALASSPPAEGSGGDEPVEAEVWPSAIYSEAVKVLMCWDAANAPSKNTRLVNHHLLEEAITRLRDVVEAMRVGEQSERAPDADRDTLEMLRAKANDWASEVVDMHKTIAARDKRIAELEAQLALAESRTHVVLDFLGLPHYFDLLGAVKSLHESHATKAERIAELERSLEEVRRARDIQNEALERLVDPITGDAFFSIMGKGDPAEEWHATFGGPYDSYTLCERDPDGENLLFSRERYDHDQGHWVEGTERVSGMLIDDESGEAEARTAHETEMRELSQKLRATITDREHEITRLTAQVADNAIAAEREMRELRRERDAAKRPPFLAPGFAVVSQDAIKRHLDTIATLESRLAAMQAVVDAAKELAGVLPAHRAWTGFERTLVEAIQRLVMTEALPAADAPATEYGDADCFKCGAPVPEPMVCDRCEPVAAAIPPTPASDGVETSACPHCGKADNLLFVAGDPRPACCRTCGWVHVTKDSSGASGSADAAHGDTAEAAPSGSVCGNSAQPVAPAGGSDATTRSDAAHGWPRVMAPDPMGGSPLTEADVSRLVEEGVRRAMLPIITRASGRVHGPARGALSALCEELRAAATAGGKSDA